MAGLGFFVRLVKEKKWYTQRRVTMTDGSVFGKIQGAIAKAIRRA